MIRILDDVLPDPIAYLAAARRRTYGDVKAGADTFKGISICGRSDVARVAEEQTGGVTALSFFRRSPEGQVEPNYIHSDEQMGDFTGIYYLNPDPPEGDGTSFWKRQGAALEHTQLVPARFNRLVLFPSHLLHSRALYDNYGHGDSARLIQVIFLRVKA